MEKYIISILLLSLALLVGCQSKDDKSASSKNPPKKEVAKVDGEKIYKMNCVVCHGADGKLGINNAGDITASKLTVDERIQLITKGKNTMTPFESLLNAEQIKAVAEYTTKL
jgi:mono/diheme cytochrome c family protein